MTVEGVQGEGTGSARDALVCAILPAVRPDLPALSALDRRDAWARFDAAAPWTLRAAVAAAGVVVTRILPWVWGYRRPWAALSADERDAVLTRADALPGLADALEVAKLAACFLWFDDARVQDGWRGGAP